MGETLFLAHRVPFPPDRGDKIRSHHLLKALARRGAVHVGTFGEVAAMCVSVLNPSVIVIGGQLGSRVQEIIAGVREIVYRRSIPLATQHLDISTARGGVSAGIRGAGLMVLDDLLSADAIDDLIERSTARVMIAG